ncbi:hypothetical protein B484DRAFT_100782 [Ochromonadaceae sp. CCMP2298]|nr:hypothetical protein B484DRAFT_100782 [Ochromonadaceae sp. CCMP2298]
MYVYTCLFVNLLTILSNPPISLLLPTPITQSQPPLPTRTLTQAPCTPSKQTRGEADPGHRLTEEKKLQIRTQHNNPQIIYPCRNKTLIITGPCG